MERTTDIVGVMNQRDFALGSFSAGLSGGDAFTTSFTGGVMDSFALGPAIREATVFADAPENPRPLSEDAYKNSPYFRKELPYDRNMTEHRAAALAEFIDAKRARDRKLENTPGWAIQAAGMIAGQALDPINYIPILGPTARAASITRLGVVGGRALVGGADAAINTAFFGAVTAPLRIAQGQPVTMENLMLEVATAAIIGGVFGTIGGALSKRRVNVGNVALAEVETARQNLEDGVSSLLETGEITVRPETLQRVAAIADRHNPAATDLIPGRLIGEAPERFEGQRIPTDTAPIAAVKIDARIPDLTKIVDDASVEAAARRAAPALFDEVDNSKKLIATYRTWIADIRDRNVDTSLKEVDTEISELTAALAKASGKRAGKIRKELTALDRRKRGIIDKSGETADVTELRRLLMIEDVKLRDLAPDVSRVINTAEGKRAGAAANREAIRNMLSQEDLPAPREITGFDVPAVQRAAMIQKAIRQPKIDGYSPAPTPLPEQAGTALPIVRSGVSTPKQIADEFEVDTEGGFAELDDFDVLKAQNRLSPEEIKQFDNATEVVARSKSYADALRQAASCEVG